MHYHFSWQQATEHFFTIDLTVASNATDRLELQLPAWRPGRYELAHYARNVRDFAAFGDDNRPLTWEKVARDRWAVRARGQQTVRVRYEYYAHQLDAGGCWLDEARCYVNFVNCALWVVGRAHEPCTVAIDLPARFKVACALPTDGPHRWRADSYPQLADSPLLAAADLQHYRYEVEEVPFHVWIHGDWTPDWPQLHTDFQLFTERQMALFGAFPEDAYHFIIIALPTRHYHGVEHRNATVIVLGPDYELHHPDLYRELLGVSSHELFHAWNVLRIRPAELMPYDLTQEQYFRTGYVAEGLTTYYGDLMLARATVFSEDDYRRELDQLLRRHFLNYGRQRRSVADSSFDLWLDGYSPGVPHRKGSIYVEGAVAALVLDLELRALTSNGRSLDAVMRRLWEEFGEHHAGQPARGYTQQDYKRTVEAVAGRKLDGYFQACLHGTGNLTERIDQALRWVGWRLEAVAPATWPEAVWGLRTTPLDGRPRVTATAPHSPAARLLQADDELVALDGRRLTDQLAHLPPAPGGTLTLFRGEQLRSVVMRADDRPFFVTHRVVADPAAAATHHDNRRRWLS